jgi:signal transduction histidine kinase
VTYLGSVSTAVLLVVFAVLYTDWRPSPTPRRIALLFVVPATSLLLLATDPVHDLFFTAVAEVAFGDFTVFVTERGPWFWVNTLYSYVLFGAATALLAGFAINNHRVYRRQALSVLAGVSIPWLVNLTYLLYPGNGLGLPADPTPAGFAAGSGLLAYAVIGAGLTDLTPIARSAVIDAIDDAVFVLDGDGRIVDYNPVAETLLEVDDPIGRPVCEVLPGSLLAQDVEADPDPVTVDDADRWHQARRLPLADEGSVLLVSDLTEQVRRRRQLRERNERLEEFTHVAAHDLRNPLNTVSGYTELARETGDVSHLDQVGDPAGRDARR